MRKIPQISNNYGGGRLGDREGLGLISVLYKILDLFNYSLIFSSSYRHCIYCDYYKKWDSWNHRPRQLRSHKILEVGQENLIFPEIVGSYIRAKAQNLTDLL